MIRLQGNYRRRFSSTALEDVSKSLGVTKPALYHYVRNKNELLTTIYTQAFENIFSESTSSVCWKMDTWRRRQR
ncbi:MAG: helix-turn-helix transcriptional regulator [Proteobacteria bacterium]|nr:helix-turn-helix transcriptional regulator [Pseudomonadota bacterium]